MNFYIFFYYKKKLYLEILDAQESDEEALMINNGHHPHQYNENFELSSNIVVNGATGCSQDSQSMRDKIDEEIQHQFTGTLKTPTENESISMDSNNHPTLNNMLLQPIVNSNFSQMLLRQRQQQVKN